MKSYNLKEKSLESFWQEMVAKSKLRSGSIRQFCKENRVAEKAFYEWRNKLEDLPEESPQDAFIKVQIDSENLHSRYPRLPDPKWVAELLRELFKELR